MSELPTYSRAVVVGGGVVGCSTAYHLAKQRRVSEAHAPFRYPHAAHFPRGLRPPYVHSPRSERTGIAIREIPEP